jgi:uncharacterized protein (TIGR02677 family)
LIGRLEPRAHLQGDEARQLIEAGERFVGEVIIATDAIAEGIRDIESAGSERLFQAAADRAFYGACETAEAVAAVCGQWRSRWRAFCAWFISGGDRRCNAEILCERARTSITALLSAIANTSEGKIQRIDRFTDFRVLARWFAEAQSDAEAHRLWRTLFGLCPARHLVVNDRTLDDHERQVIPFNTSWMDAPPLLISTPLPTYGDAARTGRLSRIVDRTEEKQKLAAATEAETVRLLKAQSRFGAGRIRLSELQELDPAEFDLFLDILGQAASARIFPAEAAEILSGDGRFRIRLESTDDGREAVILTNAGSFSGPDHWITLERALAEEAPV